MTSVGTEHLGQLKISFGIHIKSLNMAGGGSETLKLYCVINKRSLSPASIRVVVRSATMSQIVPGAVVQFTLGDLNMTTSTNESGLATFTLK